MISRYNWQMGLDQWKLKVKRANVPWLRWLPGFYRRLQRLNLPSPAGLKPLLRLFYGLHFSVLVLVRRVLVLFYKEPLFRSRCTSVGKNLQLFREMPYVNGHSEILIGDDVTVTGHLAIMSGRFLDRPVLRIGNRCVIGGNTVISVNREVVIEDDVMISTDCRIADNDGHPRDAQLRAEYAPLQQRDMQPVRIRRYAWIGNGAQVHKGVTIGEGAIIGANSVVISNIPAYCVAMGNPAEVFFKNIGGPKQTKPDSAA